MKRHADPPSRPSKKQRLDTMTLINKLQDDDEDEQERRRVEDAKQAVEMAYKEGRRKLRKEFRTLLPERVLPKRRLQLEQKLEFEETLKRDRLTDIEAESTARVETLHDKRAKRSEEQEVNEKIEECGDIASQEFSSASWQTIGKFRCCVARMAENDLTTTQRTRYAEVLQELKAKGWRVHQHKTDIKVDDAIQNDATATATEQATEPTA